jgi:hypothetical protein
VQAVRDGEVSTDPRIGGSATCGAGVHERQLQHLTAAAE